MKSYPVVDYRSFNLQARHPDAIYIHNPYDDCNFVTSVDPAFYSKVIKNYTDELVYVPYFVLGDIDPENDAALEGMAHFVMVPGVINANKVIVQSENMRQAYIKIMTNQTGDNTREYWEKKIDGSGSPKFDRIKRIKADEVTIPEEWKQYSDKVALLWRPHPLIKATISFIMVMEAAWYSFARV